MNVDPPPAPGPRGRRVGVYWTGLACRAAAVAALAAVVGPLTVSWAQDRGQVVDLIQAGRARDKFNVNGHNLAVAIIDTGLNVNHIDFAGEGRIPARRNFTDEDGGDPEIVTDRLRHGTHLAGLIAAHAVGARRERGRHTGIAPGANLIPLKIMSQYGCEVDVILKALDWVLENREKYHISVVVLPFGDGRNWTSDEDVDLKPFHEIGQRLRQLRDNNVPVVTVAGNSWAVYNRKGLPGPVRSGMQFPAICRWAVSVGAVYDRDDGPRSYGSFGGAEATKIHADQITPFSQRLHPQEGGACRTTIFAPTGPMPSSGGDEDGPRGESIEEGTTASAGIAAGVILLLQEAYQRATGKLPEVWRLEGWLNHAGIPIEDKDEGLDNVKHTGERFHRLDAFRALEMLHKEVPNPGTSER